MKGTEKQIRWAEDIIANAQTAMDLMVKNYRALTDRADEKLAVDTLKYTEADVEAVREMFNRNIETATASQIIDSRNRFSQKFFEEMAKAHHNREDKR